MRFLTTDAAAGMLKVSPRRVRAMVNDGILSGRQVAGGRGGGRTGLVWLIDPASVEAVRSGERKRGRPRKAYRHDLCWVLPNGRSQ